MHKPQTLTELAGNEIVLRYRSGQIDFCDLEFAKYIEISDCNLDDINFRNCSLDGTFERVSFRNADFSHGSIKATKFVNCDLTFANFKSSYIDAVEMIGCEISHACFDDAACQSFKIAKNELPEWLGKRT